MTDQEQRTAFANVPAALGLLTALASGAADDAHKHLHLLLAEGRAEGVIKALCLLNLNTGLDDKELPVIQAEFQSAALTWAKYEDLGDGERLADEKELAALVHEKCDCKHSAGQHLGRHQWPFWDFGMQTTSPCDFCECQAFR